MLHTISIAQKAWADAIGEQIGEGKMRRAKRLVEDVRRVVSASD